MKTAVVIAWHNPDQKDWFIEHSQIIRKKHIFFEQDKNKDGCAVTKNRGITKALDAGYEIIIVVDDDCDPGPINEFISDYEKAFEPQDFPMFEQITEPQSRGTPWFNRTIKLPVAAVMGYWKFIGDLDAPSQLVHGAEIAMTFRRDLMFHRTFPFSGMNCAFRAEFWPHFKFDEEHPRMDDIFMGYRFQKEAYSRGYCISLRGPDVRHCRQSNIWQNLKVEAENLEKNETMWTK